MLSTIVESLFFSIALEDGGLRWTKETAFFKSLSSVDPKNEAHMVKSQIKLHFNLLRRKLLLPFPYFLINERFFKLYDILEFSDISQT